jgi:hypothetical protein
LAGIRSERLWPVNIISKFFRQTESIPMQPLIENRLNYRNLKGFFQAALHGIGIVISKFDGREGYRQQELRAPGMSNSDKTLADRTYRQLRGDIVNGRLTAGSKLKLEALAQGL